MLQYADFRETSNFNDIKHIPKLPPPYQPLSHTLLIKSTPLDKLVYQSSSTVRLTGKVTADVVYFICVLPVPSWAISVRLIP